MALLTIFSSSGSMRLCGVFMGGGASDITLMMSDEIDESLPANGSRPVNIS